ncbi:MAG: hypothetical protein Tsb009_39220 [Planctomycetaceae bacterium]
MTNTNPVAINSHYTIRPNGSLSVAAADGLLVAKSSDPDADALSITAAHVGVKALAHGTLTINADGSYSYTPKTDPADAIGTEQSTVQA